ncbi:MAG: flippase-like domain-containing protein [Thermodesulfobacteria bacterium]|nr:flippase-like domain-containing protein [Thermodesulfobacteriota bacterium]
MRKRLTFFLKLAVSVGLLAYLFRQTDFHALWQTLRHVSLPPLFVAVFFMALFQLVSAWRWKVVAEFLGFSRSYAYFLRIYLVGVYFNTFLPGLLGGDLVRVFYLVRDGCGKSAASFSILYDRGFGLLGALFLLAVFLPLEGDFLPPLARKVLFLFSVAFLVGTVLLAVFLRFLRSRISHELFQTATAVTRPDRFALLFFLGLTVQVLYNIHVFFLGEGLGLEVAWPRYFLFVPLMGILASLPVSLGGFGVREGTLSYFLGLLGYSTEVGVALGFLVYGVNLLAGLAGWVLYLRTGSEEGREERWSSVTS